MKIIKYNSFLLEGKIIELLLEGNLMASDAFMKKLSIINTPIATKVYNAFKNKLEINKDLTQNWIDISDKNDTVTFISDRSANKIIGSNPEVDVFKSKGRNEIKVGRLVRSILSELGEKVIDKDIEVFVNNYKASFDQNDNFKLVKGDEIAKWYFKGSYKSEKGTLGDSCMRYDECQEYFDIYTENKCCQLLILLDDEDKLIGRAIVWEINKVNFNKECNSKYFMDRVYTMNDSDVIKFTNYAKSNNWLYKWRMNANDQEALIFKLGDDFFLGELNVKLTNYKNIEKYPFLDTIGFLNKKTGILSNVGFTDNNQLMLGDTDGGSHECDSCDNTGYDENISEDECTSCEGRSRIDCPTCKGIGGEICDKCNSKGVIICKKCDGRGDTQCTDCNGNGEFDCGDCNGSGSLDCKSCNGTGYKGPCQKCKEKGELVCPRCNGEKMWQKPWGKFFRKVPCPQCYASGKITCPDCDGEGEEICKVCSDSSWSYSWRSTQGKIQCNKCNGNGTYECKKCNGNGCLECKECDGDGNHGECDKCDGRGTIGDCKNKKCEYGQMDCPDCKGTGERQKWQKQPKCPACTGILDSLKKEIESVDNEYSEIKKYLL